MDKTPHHLSASTIAEQENTLSHPWNPNSLVHGSYLSRAVGLTRAHVNLGRLPPGKESFIYHAHHREEEWIYILSGRGVAEIDDQTVEVGAGDFMGFPVGVAHHLTNPFDEDLIYLVGGESVDIEVADFPRLGRRMIRYADRVEIFNVADARDMQSMEVMREEINRDLDALDSTS